jgi:hypothetical protein
MTDRFGSHVESVQPTRWWPSFSSGVDKNTLLPHRGARIQCFRVEQTLIKAISYWLNRLYDLSARKSECDSPGFSSTSCPPRPCEAACQASWILERRTHMVPRELLQEVGSVWWPSRLIYWTHSFLCNGLSAAFSDLLALCFVVGVLGHSNACWMMDMQICLKRWQRPPVGVTEA